MSYCIVNDICIYFSFRQIHVTDHPAPYKLHAAQFSRAFRARCWSNVSVRLHVHQTAGDSSQECYHCEQKRQNSIDQMHNCTLYWIYMILGHIGLLRPCRYIDLDLINPQATGDVQERLSTIKHCHNALKVPVSEGLM